MSRTVRFDRTGGPEVLRVEDVEIPAPAEGEVRIRTRALGLNRAEAMFRSGTYVIDPVLPSGIGYEASGTVEAVGGGVGHLAVGDAVSVVPAFPMTEYALHGELVLAPADAVVKHPADLLDWQQAAALWMPYITAYGGLVEAAGLRAGDTVLLPAASSSVGLAAIQTARMLGAQPVALTRTGAKRDRLLAAGAAEVIATAEEDMVARVHALTGGAGARVAFDPVGGPATARLAEAAAAGGIIVAYGAMDGSSITLPVMDVLGKRLTLRGFELFETTRDVARRKAAVDFVLDGLSRRLLQPVIDRTFPLQEIAEAHRYLEAGTQVGKVVVTVPGR
ncbi:alcohol dehydrogenase [Mangrovactinospora gilvigrisea]|uniref:Alcohol dehydrogenase n=1 Tax=Mangrovactinospora gilvigrisea TaxID=1428644 RepID=A0A1J7CBK8_9ACTN|nr:zinc-dependent alcohol dehydrogenase family protein [Mangrovactinospora gilvigrisea]OIV37026.1 alcohol dehydrogenase [Mangrovactinospora gilvigrisea]